MDRFSYVRTLRDAIYGKVILARRNASNHDELVAIKMMSLEHLAARTALRGNLHIKEDGLQEFAILQSLAPHASLLHLLEDFEHDNMLCLVFTYCPYGELFDQVHGPNKTSRGVHEAVAARWFRQIVLGVAHIHATGVAHRDLSLENILLDAQQHCRICDFGLATQRGDLTTGRVGKPFYMAPEVYLGDQTSYNGFTADVWSLGILLFILVCGMPPLEVPGDHDARFRIVRQEGIRALVKMWGLRLSERVLDLIAQLLRVQPHERPSLETILLHPWLTDTDDGSCAVDCRPPTTTTDETDVGRCDGQRHGSCMAYVA